jgi:shikimate dehydrogenase
MAGTDQKKPDFWQLGLTGWPLEHSLSPLLHTTALSVEGLQGDYQLFPVPALPQGKEGLSSLVGRLRDGHLHGLNLTIPHKQSVLPFLDELSPAAAAIGAINTLVFHSGRLVGENTDAPGFSSDLERLGWQHPPLGNSVALVFGAGGVAHAAAWVLCQQGWQVHVAARRHSQSERLTAHFQAKGMEVVPLNWEASTFMLEAGMVVNATSMGMWPDQQSCAWPEGLLLPKGAMVYDMVYNPRQTVLVRRAREQGLLAENGLGMLVEQAALAFEIWTGISPPRGPMRQAVLSRLEGK